MRVFCVNGWVTAPDGRRFSTSHYVGTEDRAREQAALAPGRTWREVPPEEVPEEVRLRLERAAAQQG